MPGLFVTATGTDIGKTYVTAALVRRWRAAGRLPRALKPIVSGFDAGDWASSDPGLLLQAMGERLDAAALDRISPFRFAAPLSPDMAAAREGKSVDVAALLAVCRTRLAEAGAAPLLIEGVGGVMVPLDARRTMLDWMSDLALPVLLVAGSYLGTISHSLTAAAVLRHAGLGVAALVVNESEGSGVPLAETAATIARFVAPVPVLTLPRGATPDSAAMQALADLLPC
jgi:dethiobiotin synthetase